MEIIVDNLWSYIYGTDEELSVVKELLTFVSPASKYVYRFHTGKWDGKIRIYTFVKSGVIRTWRGLGVWLGKKLDIQTTYSGMKLVEYKDDWNQLDVELRDYQKDSVEKTIQQNYGLFELATNAGKTFISAAILKAYRDYHCCYLIHRKELFQQSYDYFKKVGLNPSVIRAGQVDYSSKIVIAMVGTLYSRVRRDTNLLNWWENVKVLVVDECHHGSARTYTKLISCLENSKVRIGMSGTIPTLDSIEGMKLRGMFGEILGKITNENLMQLGYSADSVILMVRDVWNVGLRVKVLDLNKYRPGWEKEYWNICRMEGIVRNEKRNRVAAEIAVEERKRNGVLIIVDILEHGAILKQMIPDSVFVFGNEPDRIQILNDFKSGLIDVLITSPILEEGIDVKGIKTLIMIGGGKSKRKLLQRVGRGLRKKEEELRVYDFYDTEVPLLLRHSQQRMKVYEEEGFTVRWKNGR